ncbi:MAG: bifunctional 4-hydroxy-2-oxoglutarate aldolase/2-dehydro-3-deoxy-phosphogluconate aldolase [Anaerocolumna sp.]
MNTLLERIAKNKIVPVIKLDCADDAIPLAKALIKGGLPVAEVTFRTDAAERSIKNMIAEFPEMLVGAGTITDVGQAKRAFEAGAAFLVSPGFSIKVAEFARENDLPYIPGVCTPREIMLLMEYNIPLAKFFPAKQYGGLDTIKALAPAFPSIKFMPTGGVDASNINEYLTFPKIIACGGSWMVKESMINEHKFSEIEKLTMEAVELVR